VVVNNQIKKGLLLSLSVNFFLNRWCDSVATYARCGGVFNNDFTANLPRNLSVKKLQID